MAASLETNKLLAALLTAGIIASGSGVISRILYQPTAPEEPAYQVEVAEAEGEGGEGAEQQGPPLPVLLANASPDEGESAARPCQACHSFEQGGAAKVGPPLWGVVGEDIASVEDFSYSDALASKEGEWTYEHLDAFLTDPQEWAPGTKMTFAGIGNAEDRADLLLYLRSLDDSPPPLPEVDEAMQAQAEGEAAEGEQPAAEGEAGDGADSFAAMVAEADPAAGEKAARPCVACHSFEEGGPVKIGPPLHDVVGRDIAAVEDFSYSDALASKGGAWTYEDLNAFLTNPREWAAGTKMAFAGVKKDQDRAAIVAYLRSITEDPPPLPGGG